MKICFPISKKSFFIFIICIFIAILIPYILLTITLNKSKSDSIDYNFSLDNYLINDIITEEAHKKEIIEKYINKKVVALTFDDGPSKYTEKLLDILKENDVHATFFLLGYKVEDKMETVQRMKKEGNNVGIHGYTHKLFTKLNEEEVNYEIETCRDIIENVIQDKVNLIRVPYGSINSTVKDVIEKHQMNSIMWNIDSRDWSLRNKNKIVKRVVKNAKDRKIILMHDTYEFSVNAAKEIIQKLKADDYYFVTIDELLVLKNIENQNREAK